MINKILKKMRLRKLIWTLPLLTIASNIEAQRRLDADDKRSETTEIGATTQNKSVVNDSIIDKIEVRSKGVPEPKKSEEITPKTDATKADVSIEKKAKEANKKSKKNAKVTSKKKEIITTSYFPKDKNKPAEGPTVENVSVLNGSKDDFAPFFFENGILFCSNSRKVKKGEDEDKVPDDLNLKYAAFDSVGQLMKPKSFGYRTNSKTHEGPSCFTSSGDSMFLTRNMSKGGIDRANKEGKFTLKIYIKSRDTAGNFIGDKMLPFELDNYSYCHPALSKDGKRLYFASNMPGGFGGMDLYMIRKINDTTWTPPINLGAKVNTPKNEIFPSLTPSGRLYFSSNGRFMKKSERGDLDIFYLDIENRTAITMPMIESINSEGDDFGIMFLPNNEKKGYFSSNRKGGSGGDDIYSFELKE
jgi:WD40-like Beta Propeller Repeat